MKPTGTKIVVPDHWAHELSKLRCWISGWRAARTLPGQMNLENVVPGEDTIRQILMAINDSKSK